MIVLVEAPSIDWELLARKLRGRCAEERIKLHELALMIGVTRTVLWRLTAGVTGCRPEAFMAVCDWLEIDPRTLFKPVPDARHLPALPAVPEPTHCFNADDWEVTYCWSDRADLHDDMFCGDVLRVAAESGLFSEIILVDDGSSDGTSRAFEQAQTDVAARGEPGRVPTDFRLVSHPRNMGKAVAMRDGLQLAAGEIVMFMDADLVGLKPEHLKAMLAPLTDESDYRSSLGVFIGGRAATTMAQKIAPFISGQRACFRKDLADFKAWERVGFGVEMMDHHMDFIAAGCDFTLQAPVPV